MHSHQNTQRKTQKIETHQTSTEQVSLIFTIETEGKKYFKSLLGLHSVSKILQLFLS